ncbi:hypothetical protein [Phage f2b1]|nr:hypothetical protein [Phage f2b1]
MSIEKIQNFLSSYQNIEKEMAEVRRLVEEGYRYDSPKVYDAANEVLKKTESFLTLLEDLDENMDTDKTNIPSVDYLFEGLPITEFVDARVKMALGDDSKATKDQLIHAAKMINHDSFCNKTCCPDTCVCGKDFTQYEGTKAEDSDADYIEKKALPVTEVGGFKIGYHENGVSFTFPAPTIHEYVESVSESTSEEINTAMDAIEEAFKDTQTFSDEDVKLLRFYVSNLPAYSERDVEGMSNFQVCYKFQTMQSLRK